MSATKDLIVETILTDVASGGPIAQVVRPTPEQIDAAIESYETALRDEAVLKRRTSDLKANLTTMVTAFGVPHAQQSKRLAGNRRSAKLTWSTMVSVNESGVGGFRAFLESKNLADLFPRFFARQDPPEYVPPPPTHRRVDGVNEVLGTLPTPLGKRISDQIAALYSQAVDTRTSAPSLKVEPEAKAKPKR